MSYKTDAAAARAKRMSCYADGGAVFGVPDSGNRGVADLVSDREAAAQARDNAAHRTSKSVMRERVLSANSPMDRAHGKED